MTANGMTASQLIEKHYRKDVRARALVMQAVATAMRDFGPVDPERADQDAHDIALRATAHLIGMIYESDAELFAAHAERDHYKALAERALMLTPSPPFVLKTDVNK